MNEHEQSERPADISCAVCERRLLPGERPSPFVTAAGAEVSVCELCKPRAEAAGWLRPEQVGAGAPDEASRRRRRRGPLLAGLRGRSGTRPRRPATGPADRGPVGSRAAEPGSGSGSTPVRTDRPGSEQQSGPGPATGTGPDVPEAIAAFNASEFPRTVAGLTRSLGTPRATAIAIRTGSGANGARLTIAWDLAWYQWEIGPGKRRPEIRQIAKGETVDQLRAADRNWNVEVADDGRLSRRPRTEA